MDDAVVRAEVNIHANDKAMDACARRCPRDPFMQHKSEASTGEGLDYLWKTVIAFQLYPFKTAGRGKDHVGATKFRYTVTRSTGAGGRHYSGVDVPGYGNEIWIDGKEKSISRSTVDLAYRNGRKEQESCGFVSGPRKLGVPGSRSYLYAMFLRFGVITSEV